jgi:sec-independent protein translocase protein TatA
MGMPGGMEWILIALVVLLLFGGKKIPELAKGLGSGIKNFKKAVKDDDEEVAKTDKADEIEDKKSETSVKTEDTTKA